MANRLLAFARLAYEVAGRSVPDRSHRFAPKRYSQPQLLACVLIKGYLGLDYRTARESIEPSGPLRDALGLTSVSDHTTLWQFARDEATPEVVSTALTETVALLRGSDRATESGHGPLAGSRSSRSTLGVCCGHASRYSEQRRAKGSPSTHQVRAYQKWAAARWAGPWLITAQLARRVPCGDYPDLPRCRGLGRVGPQRARPRRRRGRLGAEPRVGGERAHAPASRSRRGR